MKDKKQQTTLDLDFFGLCFIKCLNILFNDFGIINVFVYCIILHLVTFP